MVNRIRELLDARQLSPTQFADLIGVGRPVMSHILSERNKPSLEVVQKILDAFPDVSLAWLMKGTGPMQAATMSPPTVAAASPVVMQAPVAAALPTPLPVLPAPAAVAEVVTGLPSTTLPSQPQDFNAPVANVSPPANVTTTTPRPLPPKFRPSKTQAAPLPAASVASPVTTEAAEAVSAAPPTLPPPPIAPVAVAMPAPAETSVVAPIPTPHAGSAAFASAAPAGPAPEYQQTLFAPPAPASPAAAYAPPAGSAPPAAASGPLAPEASATENSAAAVATPSSNPAAALSFLGEPGKAIRRIVIFYRDGSFSDYVPEGY